MPLLNRVCNVVPVGASLRCQGWVAHRRAARPPVAGVRLDAEHARRRAGASAATAATVARPRRLGAQQRGAQRRRVRLNRRRGRQGLQQCRLERQRQAPWPGARSSQDGPGSSHNSAL